MIKVYSTDYRMVLIQPLNSPKKWDQPNYQNSERKPEAV